MFQSIGQKIQGAMHPGQTQQAGAAGTPPVCISNYVDAFNSKNAQALRVRSVQTHHTARCSVHIVSNCNRYLPVSNST